MSALRAHANAEKALSQHRAKPDAGEGMTELLTDARNATYQAYTKTPHPSTLGRGGSL